MRFNSLKFLLIFAAVAQSPSVLAQVSPWNSGTYVYDGAGNIMRIGSDYYVYDLAGRLIRGSADKERSGVDSFQIYSYDTFGNRLTVTTSGTPCIAGCGVSVDIDELNHIRTTSHGASYDGGGNLTQFDGYQYSYDRAQMLSRMRLPNSPLDSQYIYTADDERLAIFTAPGQWRFTVRDLDGKVLREVTASEGSPATWSWDRDHVFRDGKLLATVLPSSNVQHYHLDHLGSPKLVTGNGGAKLGIHSYYPFGDELSLGLGEPAAERLKFTGHERDDNGTYGNSIDYMHARYYAPLTGRFLSVDRGRDWEPTRPQSWNAYSYVRNNPANMIDPTGNWVFPWELLDLWSYKESSGEWKDSAFEFIHKPSWQSGLGASGKFIVASADAVALLMPAVPATGGLTQKGIRLYDVIAYGKKAAGFEKHHGVLDVWAKSNIPGYVSRAADTPAIVLTAAQHAATRTVFNEWRVKKTGSLTGKIDWTKVSAREAQELTERMFDAAGVPREVRELYYQEFNRYIYRR